MFDILREFPIVAWDFDDTLIGHQTSPAMWDFIQRNPYQQTHHIVTMRSHGWQDAIFPLLTASKSGLTTAHFKSVLNIPDDIFLRYDTARRLGHDIDNHDYCYWKGKVCRKIGALVLVDDMEGGGASEPGCFRHGIRHIHPDELIAPE